MSAADLIALAERVEKAEGPDRELDAQIAFAAGLFDYKLDYFPGCRIERGKRRSDTAVDVHVVDKGTLIYSEPYPAVTASLDAAMTLVPEGWHWQMSDWAHPVVRAKGAYQAILVRSREELTEEVFRTRCDHAATPALALTAAALRARAAQETTQ